MKKILMIVGVFLSAVAFLNAGNFKIEVKANFFQPSDEAFKDIYGNGIMYGGEASLNFWKGLEVWIGGRYLNKKGKLTFTEEQTELKIYPIEAGLKYKILTGIFNPYIGAGVGYYQFKEKNPIGEVSDKGFGYIGQIGLYLKLVGGFVIDIFVDYTYCKVKPVELEVNIGGLETGIGLGFEF